jgi:hypothetical protein
LVSKIRPTSSPAQLTTGLPELPPVMSLVLTKFSGVFGSRAEERADHSGDKSKGLTLP